MNRYAALLCLPLMFALSCDEEIQPTSDFEISDSDHSDPILSWETIELHNLSLNAVKYQWDFGNGTSSTDFEPTLNYPQGGTYTIVLTTESVDGLKEVTERQVVVKDRVIKHLVLEHLTLSSLGLEPDSKVDVFLAIRQNRDNEGLPLDKVWYQTEMVNISTGDLPYRFTVSQKVILDMSALNGMGLSFNIYARLNDQTYLLGSNGFSGGSVGSLTVPGVPLALITSSVGGAFSVECDYE